MKSTHSASEVVRMDVSPVISAATAAKCSFVRFLVSVASSPFPSAALMASATMSILFILVLGKAKAVKFVGTSGDCQMKLPICIAVDAPGDIPQMQRLVLSWSWRCSYAVAVDGCSKNET
eukprot:9059799-Ditylum_brightwellii.AAC.1